MLDQRSRVQALHGRLRFWIAVALLAAPPVALGMWAARNLHWPDDSDFFRDIAQARSFAGGNLLADPLYLGETTWYNPLVPGIVAGLSRITGTAIPTLYARAGAWLNMLGPVLLALLLARLFDPPAGLVALAVYLYGAPWGGGASTPLYSAFLYSSFFAPALFFLTLLVFAAFPEGKRRRYVLTGLLLGLTFLAHTAPFLILCVIFCIEALREARRDWRGASIRYGLLFGAAALAATPFLVSIIGHYHLTVRNPVPMQWNSRYVRWAALKQIPDGYTIAAGVALLALLVRGPRLGRRIVGGWLAACVAFVAYTFAAAEYEWPPVVPRHHPVLYLRILQPVLLGYGACLLWSIVRERAGRPRWLTAATVEPAKWAATVGAASMVLLWALPGCIRQAGDPPRTGLVSDSFLQSGMDAYRWMRSLRSDDVVLATDDRALITVGPTGAKTVAVDAIYGSLYVDAGPRHRARDDMFAALRRGDEPAFEALADEYAVTHVLWIMEDGPCFDNTPFRNLTVEFDNGKTRIYRRIKRQSPPIGP